MKKRINIDGIVQEVEVDEVEVVNSNEGRWLEYQLADGKAMKLKVILIAAYRTRDVRNKEGELNYSFEFQNIVRMI